MQTSQWLPKTMRRADRALPEADARKLLINAEWGCLASSDAKSLPLSTPLSFVLLQDAIYIHGAQSGHKMDNITAQPHVSFCVVGKTQPKFVEPGNFTTAFESAILHGRASIVLDEDERFRALEALCLKYLPEHQTAIAESVQKLGPATSVVRIDIDQLTGKARL